MGAVRRAAGRPDGRDELGVDVAAYGPEAADLVQQRAVDEQGAAGNELAVDLARLAQPHRLVAGLEVVDVVGHADQLGAAVAAGEEQVGDSVGGVPVVVVHLQHHVT